MRILVIEDDRTTAKLLRVVLEERAYAVDVSYSGDEGQTLALVNAYDGIVLDLGLADTHGLTILQSLRREKVGTPVLILSGQDEEATIVRGLDAGADDYVVKPVRNEVLLARIRALVRRPRQNVSAEAIVIGDVVLNRLKRILLVRASPIVLTPLEFNLAELLVLHLDEPVTRSGVLSGLWGENYDPSSNVVDALVNRLRRKLERAAAGLMIETVRGVGYRMTRDVPTKT